MKLQNLEFYCTPFGDIEIASDQPVKRYEESDTEFTALMLKEISDFYPEAYKALCAIYTPSKLNRTYYEFRIVHRFIRCNFSNYDQENDIDHKGLFRFEKINCPLRGECMHEGIICNPEFNTKLSERELQIMERFYDNESIEEIARIFYISPETVKNHRKNVYRKLGINSLAEFIKYAADNKIYK